MTTNKPIRSYALREGRLTKGQQRAMEELFPIWGLNIDQGKIDYEQLFQQNSETILEIGFGMGKSLVQQASDYPESNFIGIEVHKPGVGSCLVQMEELNLKNLRLFHHDAVEVLKQCINDHSLDRIQIYFPDPWPKKRHHKRRLIQKSFLELCCLKLKKGGVLHLATDWQNYAEHMLLTLQQVESLKNTSPNGGFIEKPEYRPLTKFELRGKKLGHGVWDLMFQYFS